MESTSIVIGASKSAGPAPAVQSRTSNSRDTASSWRTLCHRKIAQPRADRRGRMRHVEQHRKLPSAQQRGVIDAVAAGENDPMTVNAFARPADGTRFGSLKLTDARLRS